MGGWKAVLALALALLLGSFAFGVASGILNRASPGVAVGDADGDDEDDSGDSPEADEQADGEDIDAGDVDDDADEDDEDDEDENEEEEDEDDADNGQVVIVTPKPPR